MTKQTLRAGYIHHRNRLLKGYSEVSIFIGLFNNMMVLWIFLKYAFNIKNTYFWILPIVAAAALSIMYLFGWIWDRYKLFNEDYRWISHRNPVMMDMYETVKKNQKQADKTA